MKDSAARNGSKDEVDLGAPMLHETAEVLLDLIELTDDVARIVSRCGVRQGLCHVFVHHTSASLMLCENADPTVLRDLEAFMGAWCRMATRCFVIPPRAPTTCRPTCARF